MRIQDTGGGAQCWIYLELSELEDDESLLLRAGLRDLRLGDERGERPPLRGGDLRPDRDLECRECVKYSAVHCKSFHHHYNAEQSAYLLTWDTGQYLLLRPLEGERLRGGERRRSEGDLRPRGDLDLPPILLLGGDLPPRGGDLDLLLGGERDLRLGGLRLRGWILGTRTGAAVTSWPSI